jgi:hypothetical protein
MLKKIPYMLALLGMTGGVFIAILFGVNEDIFKDKIKVGLQNNVKIQQMEDEGAKAEMLAAEAAKNWRYYQRFHFHATGIGAMSLATLVFLMFLGAPEKQKLITSYAVSIGGFLYPFVWLGAALYGPEIGRGAAKEAFAFFGYMGGVFLLGLVATIVLTVKHDVGRPA